jgi:hypothetical protein
MKTITFKNKFNGEQVVCNEALEKVNTAVVK